MAWDRASLLSAASAAAAASKPSVSRPTYILRGHASPVHALAFFRQNARLVSADANGFIVVWSVAIKRPVAVWRAHDASVLSVQPWGDSRLISQGRDGKLLVWSWSVDDESSPGWSTILPAEQADGHRRQPWLIYTLNITTLNFCAFASCASEPNSKRQDSLIVVVAGAKDSDIELYQLPEQQIKGLITTPKDNDGKPAGMAMALGVYYNEAGQLIVLAGYENGQTCVYQRSATVLEPEIVNATGAQPAAWRQIYSSKPHVQPILALARDLIGGYYYTSAADGFVARHPLAADGEAKTVQTFHSGQQGLNVRSDGRIFCTAGWDSAGRVYLTESMTQKTALLWHKESCYSTAFATVSPISTDDKTKGTVAPNTVAHAREAKAQNTHWLALGSKDGKISLWDID